MTEFHHLIGAEDIRRAGNSMNEAAESFRRSIGDLSDILDRHQRFMNEWLIQFQESLKEKPDGP